MLCNGARRWKSDAARAAAAKSYLDAWVGNNSSMKPARTVNGPSLLVSGTSYVVATVRLERTDTPESIALRLKEHVPAIKSQWKCPIVMDLRAWAPDGSPHYQPPAPGSLVEMVRVLDEHGLAVVGVNGTPKELEFEASRDLGLPTLFAASRPSTFKCDVDDVIQMVIKKHQQEPISEDERPTGSHVEPRSSEKTRRLSGSLSVMPESSAEPCLDARSHGKSSAEPSSSVESTSGESSTASQLPEVSPSATIFQGTVRSGQQISSEKGRSLIILGSVSSGGEVLSDGDITILGKLRGRALAGLSSDSARIVATYMDPELVSIGGILSTGDQIVATGSAAMVSLDDRRQRLVFKDFLMT